MMWIEGLVAIAWFSFLYYLIFFAMGLIRARKKNQNPGNSYYLIFQITTIGKNPQSTQEAIDSIHSSVSDASYQVWVVTEPQDKNEYQGAEKIVVPREYQTKNKTKYKARACQYALEIRKERNLISDKIRIVFLDDDNLLTKEYFQQILKIKPDSVGGQGILVMRNEYGKHLFSSLADNIRPTDCISFCSFFNSRGSPMITHGEGLVVRSDVEAEIGWDFGENTLIEDFIFGRELSKKYPKKFEWLNRCIENKSPLSYKDFFKQRRRWVWGFILIFSKLSKEEILWLISRYAIAFLGIFSFAGILINLAGFLHYSFFFKLIFSLFTFCYFSYYQVGCFFNTKKLKIKERIKYHFLQFIFQYAVSVYEAGTIVASLFRAPKGFEVVRKY